MTPFCATEGCENFHGSTSKYCGSCDFEKRKLKRPKKDRKAYRMPRRTKKRASEERKYNSEVKKWIVGKMCAVFPNQKATQCHHRKGRTGYADDWARENSIPLLLDKRFWLPVSQEGHEKITQDSAFAFENGYSIKRST